MTKISIAAILAMILMLTASSASQASAPHIEDDNITSKNEIAEKRNHMDIWLDRLADFECLGCGPTYRRVDVNGYYSYGCLQFQAATFRGYVKRYNLPYQIGTDPGSDIYNCDIQKEVARAMWNEMGSTYQFGRNWYTTIYIKGLGLP